jgi:hypothetical protein
VPIKLCDSAQLITEAINTFPRSYQAGYFGCRAIGRRYLTEATPTDDLTTELGDRVRSTLKDWGAGERKAPELRSVGEFSNALREAGMHSSLVGLAGVPLPELTVVEKRRCLSGKPATDEALASFDFILLSGLRALSDRLFVGNTNVTFPMKAVLLITGFMPALDSKRVRTGLKRGGFSGMNKTQYLLPDDAAHADGKKITRLPFLLGQCWTTYTQQLQEGLANSGFPGLKEEPGRVFDILLFMQGDDDNPILVTCEPPEGDWYKLR